MSDSTLVMATAGIGAKGIVSGYSVSGKTEGDVLEGPGGRCQRLAGQARHVAVLVEEFPGSCRAGHRTIAARPGRIAGQHWCRRARRTVGRCFFILFHYDCHYAGGMAVMWKSSH